MSTPADITRQVFLLPAHQRYELAQHLLDSIDDATIAEADEQLVAELRQRREQMMRGEAIVPDWRAALSTMEKSLPI